MTYLNQAGTSWPKPEPVRRAVAEALAAPAEEWAASFDAAHRRVAAAVGASDASRLLLTPGGTSALAVAVADHPWAPGDRVVVSALEHHALFRPVAQLRARGVEVRVVPRSADGPLDLDALRAELRRGGVRLVAMTAACNVTGELLPVAEATVLAHEHAALFLVDAAQVAGWLPAGDFAPGADLFAFAGHKGLHAPWGIGGLHVAPHVSTDTPSAACELPAPGSRRACATMPGYCDVGSVDRAALAGLAAALDWLDEPARADRLGAARRLVERIASALEERPDARLLGARAPERRLPTVAFTLSGRATAEIAAAFARRGITVAAGLQCAPLAHETLGTAPDGAVRLSAGPANDEDDVERVLEALAGL